MERDSLKEEDDTEDGTSGSRVLGVLVVDGRTDGPDDERDEHARVGPEEERPSSDLVAEHGGGDGDDHVEDLEDTVVQGLDGFGRDANRVENVGKVVGDLRTGGAKTVRRR